MKTKFSKLILLLLIIMAGSSNAQVFTNYTSMNGLPDDFISGGVAIDTNNNKWFATANGVAKFDDATWTVYDTTDGLAYNFSNCIAVDKNNNVWVGSDYGVSMFDGTSWTVYDTAAGLIDNSVTYIAADIDGSVWFATAVGVSRLQAGTWTDFTTADGLSSNVVYYIHVDQAGNKWFGTQMGGVSIYNNTSFTTITKASMDSLRDDNVFAVATDLAGNRWLGTWYGITELDNTNAWMTNHDTATGLYNNYVRDIKVDSNNVVWVGLFADYNTEGGISRYDGTNWVNYTMTDGLVDKQVIRLAVDKTNALWIATGLGVSKLVDLSGIRSNATDGTFSVYPNPASDVLNIDLKNMKTEDSRLIEIYNSVQKVASFTMNPASDIISIPLQNLPAGLYFLRMGNRVEKFIINK